MVTERRPFLPRTAYPYSRAVQTRWGDNDQYGHVNNVIYYSYFDTVVNAMLIERGLLDTSGNSQDPIGLVVETGCRYAAPLSFPATLWVGLGVTHIGNSSVTYRLGITEINTETVAAEGHFTHVYVASATRRPEAVSATMRHALGDLKIAAEYMS